MRNPLILIACLAVLAGCNVIEQKTEPERTSKTFDFSLDASLGTFSGVGQPEHLTWLSGDEISIINLTTGKTMSGSLSAEESGVRTTFSGTFYGAMREGDKLAFLYPSQGYTMAADYSSATVDFSRQSASSERSLPFCAYGVATVPEGSFSNASATFSFLMSSMQLNMSGLDAGGAVEYIEVDNIGSGLSLEIEDGSLKVSGVGGVVRMYPSDCTVGSDGSGTVTLAVAPSPAVTARNVTVKTSAGISSGELSGAPVQTNASYAASAAGFVSVLPVDNQIFYTTKSGNVIEPKVTEFKDGLKVVSNEYAQGKGVISFNQAVKTVSESLFTGNTDVMTVILPKGLEVIGDSAFESCSFLTDVGMFDGLTSIRRSAFRGCMSLESVKMPGSVELIMENAFEGCTRLKSVVFSENLFEIGEKAFYRCTSLSSVKTSPSVTLMGKCVFAYCSELEAIEIPEKVTVLQDSLFMYCEKLSPVVIPEGIEYLGKHLFAYCKALKTITIPESVKHIGKDLFYGCDRLESIYSKPQVPPSLDGNIINRPDLNSIRIFVPYKSLNEYLNTLYWRDYYNSVLFPYYFE